MFNNITDCMHNLYWFMILTLIAGVYRRSHVFYLSLAGFWWFVWIGQQLLRAFLTFGMLESARKEHLWMIPPNGDRDHYWSFYWSLSFLSTWPWHAMACHGMRPPKPPAVPAVLRICEATVTSVQVDAKYCRSWEVLLKGLCHVMPWKAWGHAV